MQGDDPLLRGDVLVVEANHDRFNIRRTLVWMCVALAFAPLIQGCAPASQAYPQEFERFEVARSQGAPIAIGHMYFSRSLADGTVLDVSIVNAANQYLVDFEGNVTFYDARGAPIPRISDGSTAIVVGVDLLLSPTSPDDDFVEVASAIHDASFGPFFLTTPPVCARFETVTVNGIRDEWTLRADALQALQPATREVCPSSFVD